MQENMNHQQVSLKKTPTNSIEIDKAYFFTTSTLKLVLMSICTFGIYELYWFYKNWVLIKERTGQNIMPIWRSIFALFWAYSCFKHIKNSAAENNIQESLFIGVLGIVYFVLEILPLFPDQSEILFVMISLFSFTLLIPVNSVALRVNQHLVANFVNNEKFSGWNWVALVLGGLFFVLVLASGVFLLIIDGQLTM